MDPDDKVDDFVQGRLDSLFDIDSKIVSLLDGFSNLFQMYSNSKKLGEDELKKSFVEQTEEIYENISKIAIELRKEVKVMDSNIGVYDNNSENLMILPVSVDHKNTESGKKKLKEELDDLEGMLKEENSGANNAETSEMEGIESATS